MSDQNFQHPITQPPIPNRPDNYEAQVSPPEPELDNFIERLNAYRRIRRTIAKQQGKRLI